MGNIYLYNNFKFLIEIIKYNNKHKIKYIFKIKLIIKKKLSDHI